VTQSMREHERCSNKTKGRLSLCSNFFLVFASDMILTRVKSANRSDMTNMRWRDDSLSMSFPLRNPIWHSAQFSLRHHPHLHSERVISVKARWTWQRGEMMHKGNHVCRCNGEKPLNSCPRSLG